MPPICQLHKLFNLDGIHFLRSTPGKLWPALFTTAVFTGLREGELLGIRWGDVVLEGDDPCLHVRRGWDREIGFITPKSKAALRTVKVFPEVKRALLAWKVASPRSRDDARVFLVSPGTYRKPMKRIFERLRMDDPLYPAPTLHGLRKTFASCMAGRGITPKILQRWMGHERIEMTLQVYAKAMKDAEERQVAECLGGFAGLENPQSNVVAT
jgi:integrase